MNTQRFPRLRIFLAAVLMQSCVSADVNSHQERLEKLVYKCVTAQITAGNTLIYAPHRSVNERTLVFADVRYLPDGEEIEVSLSTERIYPDGPTAMCRFRKENEVIAAVIYSFDAQHVERRTFIPHPVDSMSESEARAYLDRRDWITATFDLRMLENRK